MANEFRKVTDLNGVDHPVCDDTRVAWADAGKSVKKNYGKVLLNTAVGGDGTAGYTIFTNNGAITLIAPIEAGKAYKVTKKSASIGDRFKIVLFADYPSATATLNASQLINDATKTEYEFTNTNYKYATFFCNYSSNVSVSDIEPMICPASIVDDTYEPYIPDNTELFPRSEQAVLGAKNLLENKATSTGIFTVNADGSVKMNGSNSSDTTLVLNQFVLPKGRYILSSGETSQGNNIHYNVTAMNGNTTVRTIKEVQSVDNQEFEIDYADYDNIKVLIWVRANTNPSNITGYPMIRLATDTDDTYTPYAMTNRELTEKVQGIIDAVTNAADFAAFKTAIGNL